jgi:hypothetical protein
VNARTPLVVAADIEPGPRHAVQAKRDEWEGFLDCAERIDRWRGRVLETTGRRLCITWFVRIDEQMAAYGSPTWALTHFAEVLRELEAKGDEVGLHFHAYRSDGFGGWYQDYVDRAWLQSALTAAIGGFADARGSPPRYFRTGDGWLSPDLLSCLEQLGIEVDLTPEPGRPTLQVSAPDIGAWPDYTRAPRRPYRPSTTDVASEERNGDRGIWVMPVTTSCFAHPGRFHPGNRAGHETRQLHLGLPPRFVQPFIDGVLKPGRAPIVAVLRTGDIDWSQDLLPNIDYLLGHPKLANVVVIPPAEALASYQATIGDRSWFSRVARLSPLARQRSTGATR